MGVKNDPFPRYMGASEPNHSSYRICYAIPEKVAFTGKVIFLPQTDFFLSLNKFCHSRNTSLRKGCYREKRNWKWKRINDKNPGPLLFLPVEYPHCTMSYDDDVAWWSLSGSDTPLNCLNSWHFHRPAYVF